MMCREGGLARYSECCDSIARKQANSNVASAAAREVIIVALNNGNLYDMLMTAAALSRAPIATRIEK